MNGITRGLTIGVAAVWSALLPGEAVAQSRPPTSGFPVEGQPPPASAPPPAAPVPAPVPQGPAPAGSAPAPGYPAAGPGAPPAYGGPPNYPGAPPYGAQPGYGPPPGYGTPPGYSAPPAEYGSAPGAYGEGEAASPAPEGAAMQRGLYCGGRLGVGGPFGSNTTGGSYGEGVGVLLQAGYAFIPYFGANLFLHWNHSSLTIRDSDAANIDTNSGHVLLYGAELRGMLPAGKFVGWASLGLALGSGSLTLESHHDGFAGTVKDKTTGTLSVNPMPVLGFGAEYEIVNGLSIGPEFRWYVVSASEVCFDQQTTGFQSSPQRCEKDFAKIAVPDIVFIGAGATYRLPL